MKLARDGLWNRIRSLMFWAAVAPTLAAASAAQADLITQLPFNGVSPSFAAEVDELSRGDAEVKDAINSFQKRDLETCLQHLGRAVKAHPELPPAHALLAKLAFLSNQLALARPALETAVVQAPDHPEIYLLFGNLALLENRATDAALHFEKAKALAEATRWTADQRHRFERFCHQGDALVAESRGDWKAARLALEAWLALEPANARARQRLGKALFSLDQQDEAYKELQKAAQEDKSLELAEVMMGWLYTRAGNLKKAEEWMNYAAKTSPDSLPVQTAFTSWLLEQGRGDEAQSPADAAAKLDPKSNQVLRLLGLVARERKQYGQSEAILQALALESPGDAWVRNQLALVLAEQGDDVKRKRALELAELSVRQNPNALDALVTLGTVYYRLKRLDDAEKVLQAVVNSGKANSDTAYILALVKLARGQPDSAPALLKTALSAPGLFIYRKDAQQCLDRLTTKSPK